MKVQPDRVSNAGLLIVVISGLLSLIMVAAVLFLSFARMERQRATGDADRERAKLLARSGMEYAMARLVERPGRAGAWQAILPEEDWRYRGDAETELKRSLNPSFNADPYTDINADGRFSAGDAYDDLDGNRRYDGWSGRMRGSYGAMSDRFRLRIGDLNGKLYVNGGITDAQDRDGDGIPDHRDLNVAGGKNGQGIGWNRELARILNRLGDELNVTDLGGRVLSNRPEGGYSSFEELVRLAEIPAGMSVHLTPFADVDEKVIHPNGYYSEGEFYKAGADLKIARGRPQLEEGGRAPVAFDSASPEVVRALCSGLSGVLWNHWLGETGRMFPVELMPEESEWVAAEFLSARRENRIYDWPSFHEFCDRLAEKGLFEDVPQLFPAHLSRQVKGDLLKANFNPNSDLNKNLPDHSMWRWVDKSDLVRYSTEFTFAPSGLFQVESQGTLFPASGEDGRSAERFVSALVRGWETYTATTQADFVGGTFRRESSPFSDPLMGGSGEEDGSTFFRTVSYPEPESVLRPLLPDAVREIVGSDAGPALYDGRIGLSTVEVSLRPETVEESGHTFIHHFNAYDADVGIVPALLRTTSNAKLQTDPSVSSWDDVSPGTLYPDGIHLQEERTPAYDTANLAGGGTMGAASMWVKSWGTDNELYMNIFQSVPVESEQSVNLYGTQFFGLGRTSLLAGGNIQPKDGFYYYIDKTDGRRDHTGNEVWTYRDGWKGGTFRQDSLVEGILLEDAPVNSSFNVGLMGVNMNPVTHEDDKHEDGAYVERGYGNDLGVWKLVGGCWRMAPPEADLGWQYRWLGYFENSVRIEGPGGVSNGPSSGSASKCINYLLGHKGFRWSDAMKGGGDVAFFTAHSEQEEVIEITNRTNGYRGNTSGFSMLTPFLGEPFHLGRDVDMTRLGKKALKNTLAGTMDAGVFRNHAVLDEFVLQETIPDPLSFYKPSPIRPATFFTAMRERWSDGRYYKENDAVYTSPVVELPGKARSVRWTQILPRHFARNGYTGEPYKPVASLSDARCAVRLLKKTGGEGGAWKPVTPWCYDENGTGLKLTADTDGKIRFQVRFEPTPHWTESERLNQPVLETPFLDDLSICYTPNNPGIFRYRER